MAHVARIHHRDDGTRRVVSRRDPDVVRFQKNDVSLVARLQHTHFACQAASCRTSHCRDLKGLVAGHRLWREKMPGIGHRERQITAQKALHVKKGAHQKEWIGTVLVAVDIRTQARHDAIVEALLDRRTTMTHLHLNGDRDRDVPTFVRVGFPRINIAGIGIPSIRCSNLSFWCCGIAPSYAVYLRHFWTDLCVVH